MVGHAGEAVEEVFDILKGFVAVAFGTFDQGVKDGAAFPGVFSADEQPVLLADRRWADGVLNEVVVCLYLAVVKEGFELRPKVSAPAKSASTSPSTPKAQTTSNTR